MFKTALFCEQRFNEGNKSFLAYIIFELLPHSQTSHIIIADIV
jgi:hypothetical protein